MPCLVPLLTCGSEKVSIHDHLYMNLTGHTLKGFGMLAYMIVCSASGRLLVICPRAHHHTTVYMPKRILFQEGLRLLMGL
jgi:hypothetical protein